MKNIRISFIYVLLAAMFFSCDKDAGEAKYTLYTSSGDIDSRLAEFKNELGELNTIPGNTNGRREINWDGVPDEWLDQDLPLNFFNQVGNNAPATLQRGLVYENDGFQVSANRFAHINNHTTTEFSAFSGTKTFANVSNALWPIGFELPGQATPAFVTAFGAVFSDVDLDNSTSLEFFDGDKSLGRFFVPAHDGVTKTSFFGIRFHNRKITRIVVGHSGRLSDGEKDISQGGTKDLIVLDDLIYSEPLRR